ncbi:MAG: hypothetical protein IKW39_01455, partial [Alphaproteobacteria bacterium]|nr:hypothetical protein [Alphaproteobacteria bacterium]
MIIEEKNLSSTEKILFFPTTAPIIGTFSIKDTSSFDLVKNLKQINLAKDFILTKDFLYIEAQSQELLEDLYLICLGELDDYISSPSPQ